MSATDPRSLERSAVRRSRRLPVIWTIPIIAIVIGAWLAWDTLSKEGPTITITFETAEGLQAGQSLLKFRDISLGTVKSLALSDDHTHVLVTVATTRPADPLLTVCLECLSPAERRALERDLEAAARVQAALLPPRQLRIDRGSDPVDFVGGEQAGIDQGKMVEWRARAGNAAALGQVVDVRSVPIGRLKIGEQHPEPRITRFRIGRQPDPAHQDTADSRRPSVAQ